VPPRRRASKQPADPLAHLEKEGLRPLYAIDGDERLMVDEALKVIRNRALEGAAVDFNLDVFIAKDVPPDRILEAARMLPAFAQHRVVIVKDAEKLNADAQTTLLRYIEDPSPTTVLIFVAAKLDARTKFYKRLKKAGATIRFAHPHIGDMPGIVRQRAKLLGLRVEPGAVRALVDSVGANVAGSVAALEKLLLYVGPSSGAAVSAADVAMVVAHVREESIFDLAEAIGRKDTPAALALVHAMLSTDRAHPLQLLALIARHWRQLLIARSLLDASAPRGELQSGLGVSPGVVNKLVGQARAQSLPALAAGLRTIAATDQALKGGKLQPARVMERLVLRLVGSA